MKNFKKLLLPIVAVVAFAPAVPTMANSAAVRNTVANDTPYKAAASSSVSGIKFQIAPIKTGATEANTSYLTAPYHVKGSSRR